MVDRLFIKVHNGFPEHPKTVALSDKAFRALVELWCYCSRNTTDGVLTKKYTQKFHTRRVLDELVAVGYLHDDGDQYRMHDYLDHQQSAADIADLREKRAAAGRRGGQAKAKGLASASALASSGNKQTASKSVPDIDVDTEREELLRSSPSELRSDVSDICSYLADRIEANGSKRPAVTKEWHTAARLMIDRDGRTVDQIRKAIDWSQEHHFWRANILSMSSLRRQYERLRLAAADPKTKTTVTYSAPGERKGNYA